MTTKFTKIDDSSYEVREGGKLLGTVTKYRESTPLMTNDGGLHYSYGTSVATRWRYETTRGFRKPAVHSTGFETRRAAAYWLVRVVEASAEAVSA